MKAAIFVLALVVVGRAQTEETLFKTAVSAFERKDFLLAEQYFTRLTKDYIGSNRAQDYYYYQYESLIGISNVGSSRTLKHRQSGNTHPRGTLTIRFGDSAARGNSVRNKEISVAEKYLSHGTFVKYREYFLWHLLWLYKKQDREKQIRTAEELMRYDDLQAYIYSRYILALYGYLDHDYVKSIALYDQIVKIDTASDAERAKFCLLIADCYYQLGNIKDAFKYLKAAKHFERNDANKFNSRMADKWETIISEYLKTGAKGKKPQLVFVD